MEVNNKLTTTQCRLLLPLPLISYLLNPSLTHTSSQSAYDDSSLLYPEAPEQIEDDPSNYVGEVSIIYKTDKKTDVFI